MNFFNSHERKKAAAIAAGKGNVINAHQHCSRNRKALEESQVAGCFYCLEHFAPSEVEDWVDDDATALCPRCGIDSVIGDKSGYPVSKTQFLQEMNGFWF